MNIVKEYYKAYYARLNQTLKIFNIIEVLAKLSDFMLLASPFFKGGLRGFNNFNTINKLKY